MPRLVETPISTSVLKSTIATASLSTDSPKMSAFSFGSAPVDEKIASVATGSTAEMSAANAADSIGVSSPCGPPSPQYSEKAVTPVAISVPANASARMPPRFEKKNEWLRL